MVLRVGDVLAHVAAEDEVVLPALAARVNNVAHAYELEHDMAEDELFDGGEGRKQRHNTNNTTHPPGDDEFISPRATGATSASAYLSGATHTHTHAHFFFFFFPLSLSFCVIRNTTQHNTPSVNPPSPHLISSHRIASLCLARRLPFLARPPAAACGWLDYPT